MMNDEYEISVQVYIRALAGSGGGLNMGESMVVKFENVSAMAHVLVKLHEFFEQLKAQKVVK